ncbi:universal stress protein [Shewanella amazonensis]|uniref:UspA n=1 Tax=Shewanella amazonensis (strain ATCC BAA-1098 / SB2B) TaxID=326297 RepID=A1S2U3_SHEAM|nr:universal stress protein [Shewanella amazonensis]ABL98699.1 UspA [Shewanella amazonensis SB2B]
MDKQYILYPTDFSESSTHALQQALELAQKSHQKLRLLHVISRPYGDDITTEPHHEDNFGIVVANATEQQAHLAAYAKERINALLANLPPDQEIEIQIDQGNATSQILAEAAREDVAMVVIGCHHHAPFTHWLHPNVAAQVVNKAHCPVLVVR